MVDISRDLLSQSEGWVAGGASLPIEGSNAVDRSAIACERKVPQVPLLSVHGQGFWAIYLSWSLLFIGPAWWLLSAHARGRNGKQRAYK